MNCFNGERYLREAIESVYQQSFTDWEIIFIDNGSTDRSAEIVKSYDDKIKYIKLTETIPLYEARNVGLRYVDGEYVAFLDTDDLWHAEKLEKQLQTFKSNDNTSLVFTNVKYIDENGKYIPRKYPKLHAGRITQKLLLRNFIAISSVLLKSEILKENQFNPLYNMNGDYDLWLRLSIDFEFDFVSDELFYCRKHSESLGTKNKWIHEMRMHYRDFLKLNRLKYPNIILYILKCEVGNLTGRY